MAKLKFWFSYFQEFYDYSASSKRQHTNILFIDMDGITMLLYGNHLQMFVFYILLWEWNSPFSRHVNPIALRMAKSLWSFGNSECSRVEGPTVLPISVCNGKNGLVTGLL